MFALKVERNAVDAGSCLAHPMPTASIMVIRRPKLCFLTVFSTLPIKYNPRSWLIRWVNNYFLAVIITSRQIMRCPAYSPISVDFFKVPVVAYFNLKLTAQICSVINPGEEGVRRPVKRRVQARVI